MEAETQRRVKRSVLDEERTPEGLLSTIRSNLLAATENQTSGRVLLGETNLTIAELVTKHALVRRIDTAVLSDVWAEAIARDLDQGHVVPAQQKIGVASGLPGIEPILVLRA